jgi:protein phosphatase
MSLDRSTAVHPAQALHVTGAMRTDVGLVRTQNEDCVLYVIPRPEDPRAAKGALALVADGMGGHAAGEVASRLAADAVLAGYYAHPGPPPAALAAALTAANETVYLQAEADPDCRGMGTTCTVIAIVGSALYLAHVGDSRAYILRDGRLHQLSLDDSLVSELVRSGAITPEEALSHPDRNVILRAVGTRPDLEPAVWQEALALQPGDRLLLCSDGLSDLVGDDALGQLAHDDAPTTTCQALIDAALAAGGYDNVSVGIFDVAYEPQPSQPARVTRPIKLTEPTP